MSNPDGYPRDAWVMAVRSGIQILEKQARKGLPITYTGFVDELNRYIGRARFEPHHPWTGRLLADISRTSYVENQVMLSVLVVSAAGNRPGKGFFSLAAELYGQPITDKEACWVAEMNRVLEQYSTVGIHC